jgi:ubiquitin carboxyl-terminal hydrolase 9/24
MEPYTAEGMSARDALKNENLMDSDSDSSPPTFNLNATPKASDSDSSHSEFGESLVTTSEYASAASSKQINYDLVGVVVHSGQANAGHYYSFIKDRRLDQ